MKLLVLGGGGFLGYHIAAEALAAGHEVAVLSRSGSRALDGVQVLTGDRQGDLTALETGEWDAVADTFTDSDDGAPAVQRTAALLSGRVGAYGYVSGMSVYAPGPAVPDERAPVRRPGRFDDRLQARSIAKLAGEAAVTDAFDGPALFPRVGIMVGPRDPSHRFTYWPVRIADAFEGHLARTVLVPGDPERSVQYSDARDIAAWTVRMLSEQRGGTFNTVGPGRGDTMRQVLETCIAVAAERAGSEALGRGVEFRTAGEDDLAEALADIDEEELPLWFPERQIPQDAVDSSAALAAGLVFRPLARTVTDTLAWAEEHGDAALTDGEYAAREQELIRRLAR